MGDVVGLPVWKKDATAAELFDQLAQMARENPKMFDDVIVLYTEPIDDDIMYYRQVTCPAMNLANHIGLMRLHEFDIYDRALRAVNP